MEKLISIENLRNFAYCNNSICVRPIRGIVLNFYGLGGTQMFHEDKEDGCMYAEKGILYLIPYQNPWAWMNNRTVEFVDELIDVLIVAYDLPESLPIVSSGGSMGGLSALTYAAYAKRTPVACVANCPVCDLPYHYTERPDLPRTLYSAFGNYTGTMDEAMRTASPLHLVDQMPVSAAYYVFHCEKDKAVNIEMHSERFVKKMAKDHKISYYTVPERGHCDLTDAMKALYTECIVKAIVGEID